MRKFKDKHRPKRKYVRKSDPASRESLAKSNAFNYMPLFVIAIGLFATMLITTPALTRGIAQVSIPHQATDLIARPVHDGYQTLIRSFPELNVSLPRVNTEPLVKGATTFFDSLLKTISLAFVWMGGMILNGIKALGELFVKLGQTTLTLLIQGVIGLSKLIQVTFTATIQFIKLIGEGIVLMARILLNAIVASAIFLGKLTVQIFKVIVAFVITVGQMIVAAIVATYNFIVLVLTTIGNAIAKAWNAFVNLVKAPFIALGKMYKKIEPGLQFVGKSLGNATNALFESLNQLNNLPSQLSKK